MVPWRLRQRLELLVNLRLPRELLDQAQLLSLQTSVQLIDVLDFLEFFLPPFENQRLGNDIPLLLQALSLLLFLCARLSVRLLLVNEVCLGVLRDRIFAFLIMPQ